MSNSYRAMIVESSAAGVAERRIGVRNLDDLPPGDVLVRVRYSSLNYKDALSASGNRGVTRAYPHTPGIDAAGVVIEAGPETGLVPGAEVLVCGHDLGMNTPGGFAEFVRVPAGWVLARPEGLTLREAMAIGSAGFTAALMVQALRDGQVAPTSGPVLVTGATGGVGCMAVAILAGLGYSVTAVTGKAELEGFLRTLGVSAVLPRAALVGESDRPLLSSRWAGVIDTVGGGVLDAALRALRPGGVATACGMIASLRLETSIFPFILRGIRLQGIDAACTPLPERRATWCRLGGDWKPAALDSMVRTCGLDDLDDWVPAMLAGRVWGRIVVSIDD